MKPYYLTAMAVCILVMLFAGCTKGQASTSPDLSVPPGGNAAIPAGSAGTVSGDEAVVQDGLGAVSGIADDIDETESLDTLDQDLSVLNQI